MQYRKIEQNVTKYMKHFSKYDGAFKGKMFHSAEWDLSYDYKNKNVAIIGSAATAVQVSTSVVDQVNNLYVFQRSPNWFLPRYRSLLNGLTRLTLLVMI